MKMRLRFVICALAVAFAVASRAVDTPFAFKDAAQEQRYARLTAELRCMVCQNQSLADSHADLAQDMRDEVFRMLNEGLSDDEIVGFLVQRYGDFVLYRPRFGALTLLLWLGPPLLLAGAGVAWWRLGRARPEDSPPDPVEAAAIAALTRRSHDA